MGLTSDRSRTDAVFSVIVMACAVITGAMGLWIMGRWQLGLPPVLPAYRDMPPIQPLTATCLSLWSVALFAAEQRMRPLANLTCVVLIALAALRIAQAAAGRDFELDKLLFPNAFAGDAEHLRVHAGMTVTTALGLLCLTGAVAGRPYVPRLSAGLLILPSYGAAVAFVSIGFQATGPGSLMASTGTALAALGGSIVAMTGALCLDPRPRWLTRLFRPGQGARRARRLLAVILPAAFAMAWLIRLGHRAGRYDADSALALMTATSLGLLAFVILSSHRLARDRLGDQPEPAVADVTTVEPFDEAAEPSPPAAPARRLHLATESPAAVAAQAVDLFTLQAAERGLNLTLTAEGLPPLAKLDAPRVREVLVNLIDNAVKFTRQGDVRVHGAYDADGDILTFAVSDTGPGIAPDEAAGLFQVGAGGHGLAICRDLVATMGGEIWLTSTPGIGSTFSFTVPAPQAEPIEAGSGVGEDTLA